MKGLDIVNRFDALESNRKTLDTVLQQIEEFVVPFRGEFFSPMTTEQEVDWQRVYLYDNTAGVSVNLLASQMMGNVTSPVTKWFGLKFRDTDLNEEQEAKEWLEKAEEKCWETIQESNFDTAAPEMYLDIGSFGTSVMTMEDVDDLIWKGVTFNALPVMDSYFEAGPDDLPYRVYRLLRYTKLELKDTFDLPRNLDVKDKDKENTDVDSKEEVIFCIYKEPENTREETILAPTLRPVQWRYVHRASGKVLKKKGHRTAAGGYYDFPGMTIRWQKTAGSRWGYSPAMIMLSDIKQLNTQVAMIDEAWAKAIDPPLQTEELNVVGSTENIPGGLTITSGSKIEPLYPASSFNVGWEGIDRKVASIRAGFFVDKLELPDKGDMTKYEVQVRYERMLRLLAPTLGRLKTDFLMPVVMGVFNRLIRMGQLDDVPESMIDAELDVEFIGPLPRAIKGEVADGMEMWLLGIMDQALKLEKGEVLDIVDFDQYNRLMAEQRGVPAKTMRPDKEVEEIRAERADQQEQARQIEMLRAGGEAAEQAGKGGQAVVDLEQVA